MAQRTPASAALAARSEVEKQARISTLVERPGFLQVGASVAIDSVAVDYHSARFTLRRNKPSGEPRAVPGVELNSLEPQSIASRIERHPRRLRLQCNPCKPG